MLCDDVVGWSSTNDNTDRKRIIVFITDQESHYAFDGILGGITDHFDPDQCHSDLSNGYDRKENDFDYPSFGQVGTAPCKKTGLFAILRSKMAFFKWAWQKVKVLSRP